METKDRKKLEVQIREKIAILNNDIGRYKELTKPIPLDNAVGRLTRMEAIGQKAINEAALREAEKTYANLQRALKMIDNEEFGMCNLCKEPIPFGRLEIIPESDLCVACVQKMS